MKKKVFILLIMLAALLLIGATVNLFHTSFDTENEYTVVIKYATVNADGEIEVFKTYSETYADGDIISVKSPSKYGYVPEKEEIKAVANCDYNITVKYICQHVETSTKTGYTDTYHWERKICDSCGTELIYEEVEHTTIETVVNEAVYDGTQWIDGILQTACTDCEYHKDEPYKKASYSMTFGGEAFISNLNGDVDYDDGGGSDGCGSHSGYNILFADVSIASEFDVLFENGFVRFGEADLLIADNAEISCTVEYDESVWGENAISVRPKNYSSVSTDYYIRIGQTWRVIFGSPSVTIVDRDWYNSPTCPLLTSPITVTLTYDYTN
ncbi:MAG: hypothetical protein IJW79_11055 [Clostridia bacterium]|nr:hypothetical protein [Clostridia bacterium]